VFQWDANGAVTFGNAATTRTNLGLPLAALTNTNIDNFRAAIAAGTVNEGGEPSFQSVALQDGEEELFLAANAKTTMRNLSGSTNTNHPFSGNVSVVGTNNTNTLVFSNGIVLEVQ
jgi:hypothetical protein